MSTLDLKLDMSRVQSSVQASIRPAVEDALKGVDLKKLIAEALTKKKPKRDDVYGLMFGRGAHTFDTLLDQFVHEGISEIARLYVQQSIAEQRDEIEAALGKAMRGSGERITKMFVGAAMESLKNWEFSFKGSVVGPESERDDD